MIPLKPYLSQLICISIVTVSLHASLLLIDCPLTYSYPS